MLQSIVKRKYNLWLSNIRHSFTKKRKKEKKGKRKNEKRGKKGEERRGNREKNYALGAYGKARGCSAQRTRSEDGAPAAPTPMGSGKNACGDKIYCFYLFWFFIRMTFLFTKRNLSFTISLICFIFILTAPLKVAPGAAVTNDRGATFLLLFGAPIGTVKPFLIF